MGEPVKKYQEALELYYVTLKTVAGTGRRGQHHVDKQYLELLRFYDELSDTERQQVHLPRKQECDDDGSYGFSAGIAAAVSSLH